MTEGTAGEGIRDPEPESVETRLVTVGGSGITGHASLTPRGDQIAIDVVVDGAAEGERYVVQLHDGPCGRESGVLVAVAELTATEGRSRVTGTIDRVTLATGKDFSLQVHLGRDDTPVACGNLPQ